MQEQQSELQQLRQQIRNLEQEQSSQLAHMRQQLQRFEAVLLDGPKDKIIQTSNCRSGSTMKRSWSIQILTALLVLTWLAQANTSVPTGNEFSQRRVSIDSGGGTSTGDGFSLRGTVGQSDTQAMTGTSFALWGGFWTPSVNDLIFRDNFDSDNP